MAPAMSERLMKKKILTSINNSSFASEKTMYKIV